VEKLGGKMNLPGGSESVNNSPSPLLTDGEATDTLPDMPQNITLEQIRMRLNEAKSRLDSAKREVTAWEHVLAVEESRAGVKPPLDGTRTNKSEILRNFLRSHRQNGVTYEQIREHFEKVGVPMGNNFIYNLINKWGEVAERREGKIFWKGD
jgi:hypothetical protein